MLPPAPSTAMVGNGMVGNGRPLSVGIVTTADDPASCAFVQWCCERAELFGRALRLRLGWNASVRVLLEPGQSVSPDCPGALGIQVQLTHL